MKTPALQHLFNEAQRAFLRFPLVLLSGLCAAISFSTHVETNFRSENIADLLIFMLGLPLFLTISFLIEGKAVQKIGHKFALHTVGILFLVGYYFVLSKDDTQNLFVKYVHISLAIHLLVSFVAYLGVGETQNFWQLNKNIFLRLIFSFIYAAVLFFGIAAAIALGANLFDIHIKGEVYAQLWAFCAFLFQTWHFLAGLPQDIRNIEVSYPRGLKIFVQYLLIPLVSLYMVILYVYMGKIAFTRAWPQGYVGWLVSIIAILGVLNILLVEPEKNKPDSQWIVVYSKAFYILVLPLLVMLFVAVGLRIGDYGITEKRYFLIALGLWLGCLSVYFIFSRVKNIRVIPISLFIVLAITLAGPWSAFDVSRNSQIKRAEKILEKYKILVDGKIMSTKEKVSPGDEQELSSIFNYLIQQHTVKSLKVWFPEERLAKLYADESNENTYSTMSRHQNAKNIMTELGLNYSPYFRFNADGSESFYLTGSESEILNIEGYRYLYSNVSGYSDSIEIEGQKFVYKVEGTKIVISDDKNAIQEIDLQDFVQKIVDEAGRNRKDTFFPTQTKRFDLSIGKFNATLIPLSVSGSKLNGRVTSISVSGRLLVK